MLETANNQFVGKQLHEHFCRVWVGEKNPLPKTIYPKGFKVGATKKGSLAILNFTDGARGQYPLSQFPISVEYFPTINPEQYNLKVHTFSIPQFRLGFWPKYKIRMPMLTGDQPCKDIFLASRESTFSKRIKSITQSCIRPLLNKFNDFAIKLKLT